MSQSWDEAAEDYASYRDIYPSDFFRILLEMGIGTPRTKVLDVGTGTGPIPRHMTRYGAEWTGTDISAAQIRQAQRLDTDQTISWQTASAENLPFADATFDAILACQCFWYFDAPKSAQEFHRLLRPGGKLVFAYLGWLPAESDIARASEESILSCNPGWTGAGDAVRDIFVPNIYGTFFDLLPQRHATFTLSFSRESWHGRLRACRGTRLEMTPEQFDRWSHAHQQLLEEVAPPTFSVPHYAVFAGMKKSSDG